MSLSISPKVENMVRERAAVEGVSVEELLTRTFAPKQSVPDARNQALIDMLRSWREEDATDDPEELERRDIENKILMDNLQANRLTLRLPEA